jgi:CRP-like cAMP-binding protein
MANSGNESGLASGTHDATENRLLRALPARDYRRLAPDLEPVTFSVKQVLYEPNATITHAYFPTSGMASLVHAMDNGTVEVGTIGKEGMVGTPILLKAKSQPTQTFIQVAGTGHRITVEALQRVLRESPGAERLFFHYLQLVFDQLAQWVACNRLHTLEARCARWLLMTHDRVEGDDFMLTQEFLSYMLGVHRPAVSLAAGALSHAGLIRYRRGNIAIIDRVGLEAASCECYRITRSAMDTLLGPIKS